MPDPVPRERRDDDTLPFWLSPWPFLEPRYPNLPGGYANDETE